MKLKNGADEYEPFVRAVMLAVQDLAPNALIEAIEIARNQEHKPRGGTGKILQEAFLLNEHGKMSEGVRNVLLSAAQGNGPDLTIVSPEATAK